MRFCPFCLTEYGDDTRTCGSDGAHTVASKEQAKARSLLGKTVGSYVVERVLARGGMGEVYEARHPTIARRAAVKVLGAEAAKDPVIVERFFAEARSVNVIGHQNIIEVLDLALLDDGRPYLVMEYLEGETLEKRIRRAVQMPIEDIGPIALPVLDALAAAHALKIVHRDLKPGNIFLAKRHGRILPKVLDFGIAKLADPEHRGGDSGPGTSTGSVMGTPGYMAPEQAAGRVKEVDPRSDVYSMGIILYKMVTGRVPFRAEAPGDLLLMIMTEPPPPPSVHRPSTPAALEQVILRALAKRREDRWPSVRALGTALRAALVAAGVKESTLDPVAPAGAEVDPDTTSWPHVFDSGSVAVKPPAPVTSRGFGGVAAGPLPGAALDIVTASQPGTANQSAAEMLPVSRLVRHGIGRSIALAAGAAALIALGAGGALMLGSGGTEEATKAAASRPERSDAPKSAAAAEARTAAAEIDARPPATGSVSGEAPAPVPASASASASASAPPEVAPGAPAGEDGTAAPGKPHKGKKAKGSAKAPKTGGAGAAPGLAPAGPRTPRPGVPLSPEDLDRMTGPKGGK